jgi:cytochrome c oxidase assembly protein subunit 15
MEEDWMDKIAPEQTTGFSKYRNLLLVASGLTFLLIVLGGTVCMTESTLGCPDWPGCFGQIVPPLQINAIIEYSHRFVAALAGVSILASAVIGWRKYPAPGWIRWALVITVILLFAVVVFGAFAVLTGLSRGVAAIDLSSALLVLALTLAMTVTAFKGEEQAKLSLRSPFAQLGLATLVSTFLVLVSAVLVAPAGTIVRCLGWPFFRSSPVVPAAESTGELVRLVLAGLAIFLTLVTVAQAWRTQQEQKGIVTAAFVMGAFMLVEVVLSVIIGSGSTSYAVLVSYVVAAAGNWSSVVVMEQLAVTSGATT